MIKTLVSDAAASELFSYGRRKRLGALLPLPSGRDSGVALASGWTALRCCPSACFPLAIGLESNGNAARDLVLELRC